MPDLLKVFEQCRDSKCEDVVSKKEIEVSALRKDALKNELIFAKISQNHLKSLENQSKEKSPGVNNFLVL
jgi:hypothetical protein